MNGCPEYTEPVGSDAKEPAADRVRVDEKPEDVASLGRSLHRRGEARDLRALAASHVQDDELTRIRSVGARPTVREDDVATIRAEMEVRRRQNVEAGRVVVWSDGPLVRPLPARRPERSHPGAVGLDREDTLFRKFERRQGHREVGNVVAADLEHDRASVGAHAEALQRADRRSHFPVPEAPEELAQAEVGHRAQRSELNDRLRAAVAALDLEPLVGGVRAAADPTSRDDVRQRTSPGAAGGAPGEGATPIAARVRREARALRRPALGHATDAVRGAR
jgi:hypothetical protein